MLDIQKKKKKKRKKLGSVPIKTTALDFSRYFIFFLNKNMQFSSFSLDNRIVTKKNFIYMAA